MRRKVMLIGWDAADWKTINPLLDKGLMPNLERLINGGTIGNLATLDPPLSPMLWTSIATGKRPYKHGVLGFTEPHPNGEGIRPVSCLQRKVKAIWNILSQEKLKTHTVGWWPSHPAEPINGVCISNFYQKASKEMNANWPIEKGCVHPESMEDLFSDLRVHPGELTQAHIAPFIPDWEKVDIKTSKAITSVRKILADCSSIHNAATYIAENQEWDFLAVYYDAIDHFKHSFMKFHPPKREFIDKHAYTLFKNVVTSAYRYHDMMLGRLVELAGDNATILLLSDHGFHAGNLRPRFLPQEPAGPAHEHSPYGIFCINGPGIKKDERIYGAGLLDITPTLLSLFDLPIGKDMDGKPLMSVFANPSQPKLISSWEDVPGESGMHPKSLQYDSEVSDEALEQLVELGYIEDPGDDLKLAGQKNLRENRYYLGKAYIDGGEYHEAISLLKPLFDEHPGQIRYGLALAQCYHKTLQTQKSLDVIYNIKKQRALKWEEWLKENKVVGQQQVGLPSLEMLEGMANMQQGFYNKALTKFRELAKIDPPLRNIHVRIGNCLLQMNQLKGAHTSFDRALVIDAENENAWYGQGMTYLKQLNLDAALGSFFEAIGLKYYFPFAHYHIGETLYRLERFEEALQAFQVCLKMQPGVNKARLRIIRILEEHLDRKREAEHYKQQIKPAQTVYIVSGLPRSGTSMMMQVLAAGGMTVFTDAVRVEDESNPKGYFEHEAVKRLSKDNSWIGNAAEKAIKVIAHLLPFLPDNFRYKVIFMQRELGEILSSQNKMLVRLGKHQKKVLDLGLWESYQKTLEKSADWSNRRPNVELLFIDYKLTIANPDATIHRVLEFLQLSLDKSKMVAAIDKSLYRERS